MAETAAWRCQRPRRGPLPAGIMMSAVAGPSREQCHGPHIHRPTRPHVPRAEPAHTYVYTACLEIKQRCDSGRALNLYPIPKSHRNER